MDGNAGFCGQINAQRDYPGRMITRDQVRAARSLLHWSQAELARACGRPIGAIKEFERGASDPRSTTLAAIKSTLVRAGIVFIDAGEASPSGGIGVRLREGDRC